jgi:TPR repeat protein
MTDEAQSLCANCGKEEEFEAKLKSCNACKLVKYCGRDCQIAHRPKHKKACKKRAAELYDEALFKPPPKGDDCPIYFLPLPVLASGQSLRACCGKSICRGCDYAHHLQSNGNPSCPFCRADAPSAREFDKMLRKRVVCNDADAIFQLGVMYLEGDEVLSIKKDTDKVVKLFHRAAELGSANAYHNLGSLFFHGNNGVSKDEAKAKKYFEKGAMRGCASSRFSLGALDANAGSVDRAIKHWLIAASSGDIMAVHLMKRAMVKGDATRDDYAKLFEGISSTWMKL